MSKITAIYVRRSVSDKDNVSLSIESQVEECKRTLAEDEKYKVYCDDGKSAKNIDGRPAFRQMMDDARDGLIYRIIVKKYDRFSRNLKDFLGVADELDRCNVSILSITEMLDTATMTGRMVRDILLRFAQFERETIAARVADAYATRAKDTGFYLGSGGSYGYSPKRKTIGGKTGSVLVPNDEAEIIKTAYRLYQEQKVSLRDVFGYFNQSNIELKTVRRVGSKRAKDGFENTNMTKSTLTRLLGNPLYVRADVSVYQYFISKGYKIIDDVSNFDGVHGCFLHRKADGFEYVKLGYHEGIVDSEVWLAVQDKKSRNSSFPNNGKAKTSWLVGLLKCGHCGYGFTFRVRWNSDKSKKRVCLIDNGSSRANRCVAKPLEMRAEDVERQVFAAMKDRLACLEILKKENSRPNPEIERIKADIINVEKEVDDLMSKLAKADDVLFSYIQSRISNLHAKKSELTGQLREKEGRHKNTNYASLSDPMKRWDSLTIDEKKNLASAMIDVVYASNEKGIDIRFSI